MTTNPKQINPIVVAVDPGASGGIGYTDENGEVVAIKMPDDVGLVELFSSFVAIRNKQMAGNVTVYMEQVGGYIKGNPAPGSAMFNFGDGWGFIRGLCAALNLKLVLVRPQLWQTGIRGNGNRNKTERKTAYKEHAARMFPHLKKITLATADALCILNWAINGPQAMKGHAAKAVADQAKPAAGKPPGKPANVAKPETPRTPSTVFTKDRAQQIASMTFKEQVPLAEAWCKANKWPVPQRKTPEHAAMVDYWFNKAINGEA